MRSIASTLTAAAVLAAAPAFAQDKAKVKEGEAALREMNLIVLGDTKMQQEVEGKTWIGGNLSGNGGQFGIGSSKGYTNPATGAKATVTVVGNVNSSSLQLHAGNVPGGTVGPRALVVGGELRGSLNVNAADASVQARTLRNATVNGASGGTIAYGSKSGSGSVNANGSTVIANDPRLNATFTNELKAQTTRYSEALGALSQHLSAFTSDSTINRTDPNSYRFMAAPGADKVAVFSIADAATFFSTAKAFDFTLNGAESLVINVANPNSLSLLTINQNVLGGPTAFADKIVWNFGSSIQNIRFTNAFYGSVLAINSNVSNTNFIQGSVAVKRFDRGGEGMNGEIHLGAYDGASLAAVPEPATWGMMIAGFGMIGAVLRRRARALA